MNFKKLLGVSFLGFLSIGVANVNPVFADSNTYSNLVGEIDYLVNGDTIEYSGSLYSSIEIEITSNAQAVDNEVNITIAFDHFTLNNIPNNDYAFHILNSTNYTVNIIFVIDGIGNSILAGADMGSIYLEATNGTSGDINTIFTMADTSCDTSASLEFGSDNEMAQVVPMIMRDGCDGTDKLKDCTDVFYLDDATEFLDVHDVQPTEEIMFYGNTGHVYSDDDVIADSTDYPCRDVVTWSVDCQRCERTVYGSYPLEEHQWELADEEDEEHYLAPTCEVDGYQDKICQVCSETERTTLPATGHNWTKDENQSIDPTCAEGGILWEYCTNPDCEATRSTEIAALEHTYPQIPSEYVTEPTCTHSGVGKFVCIECGNETEMEVDPIAEKHNWGDWVENPVHDCTHDGVLTRECLDCGETQTDVYPAAHDLDFENKQEISGTCLNRGQYIFTCNVCGETIVEYVDDNPYNHEGSIIMVVDTPSTEESTGSAHYEYSCCHARPENTELYPDITICKTNEHEWALLQTITEATCGHDGTGLYGCNICGITKEDIISNGGLEHTWSDWTTTKAPDCSTETDGVQTRTCSVCGEVETEDVYFEHAWVERTLTESTCLTQGSWTMVCGICGYYDPDEVVYEDLDPDNHEGTKILVVDTAPTEDTEGLAHYEWSCCGESVLNEDEEVETVTLCKTNEHNWELTNTITEPNCGHEGTGDYKCSVCGLTKRDSISNDGYWHQWGEWETLIEADCDSRDGLDQVVCTVCGEVLQEVIPAGHIFSEDDNPDDNFIAPTCISPAKWTYVCARCNELVEEVLDEEYDPDNHEGVKKLVVDEAATTEKEGKGHYEWTCCGQVELNEREEPVEVTIPKLSKETAKEVLQDVLTEIIVGVDAQQGQTGEKSVAEVALENAQQETLLEVAQIASQAFEAVSNVQDQDTRQQYVESIQAATESAVIAGSKLDNSDKEANSITINLPENSLPNLKEILDLFYSIQYNTILGKDIGDLVRKAPNDGTTGGGVTVTGIDYTEAAEVYKKAVECIDNTVCHMAGAAGMIRVCSNEKISTMVNTYIEQIGVRSFKAFDKKAADLEFAEKAYEAMLINMQNQTISNLNASYEDLAKDMQGTALDALKEQYDAQLESCKDIGQFEWLVIEIMRQKYNSVLSEQLDNKVITYDEYKAKFIPEGEENLTAFKEIYTNIFYKWALGSDAAEYGYTEDYGITLQELTDATISSVVLRNEPIEITGPTSTEIIVAIVFGVASLLTAGALISFEVVKKKRGVVVAYE